MTNSSLLPLGVSTNYFGLISPNQNLLQARLFLTIPFEVIGIAHSKKDLNRFLTIGFEMSSIYKVDEGDMLYYIQQSYMDVTHEYDLEQTLKDDSNLFSVSSYTDLPSFYQHIMGEVEDLLPHMIKTYLLFAQEHIEQQLPKDMHNSAYSNELKRIQRFSRDIIEQLNNMKNDRFSASESHIHGEYEARKTFTQFINYWKMISFNQTLQQQLHTQPDFPKSKL